MTNPSGLNSDIYASAQTFAGKDLWPDVLSKGAVLFRSLMNHPFIDGNKRTTVLATIRFEYNGYSMRSRIESRLIGLAMETARGTEPGHERGRRRRGSVAGIRGRLLQMVDALPLEKPRQMGLEEAASGVLPAETIRNGLLARALRFLRLAPKDFERNPNSPALLAIPGLV